MTDTQAELREKFSKQHEKWLIGTCDDAEAAQEWVMENLPSLLALLPPAPAVGELDQLRVSAMANVMATQRDRIEELEQALSEIAAFAHDNSTGPAIPDVLWSIRDMAYRPFEAHEQTDARIKREVEAEL